MTVVDMHIAINTQLQQIDSAVVEDFVSGEIDLYLNRGQLLILKRKVREGQGREAQEEDIRTLLVEQVLYPLINRTDLPGNPVSFLLTISGGSGTLGIDLDQGTGTAPYDQAFSVDAETTATNWLSSHTSTLAALGIPIIATSVGSGLIRLSSEELFVITDGGSTMTFTQTPEAGSQFEYLCPIPDDYFTFIGGESGLTRTANPVISVKEYVPNMRISSDGQLKRYRVRTGNQPWIREPRIYLRDLFIHVLCDHETTLIDQRLVYVRKPDDILLDEDDAANNVNCELPEHIHDEVVETALQIMVRDLSLVPQGAE